MVKTILSRSSSHVLEQVDDQGLRVEKVTLMYFAPQGEGGKRRGNAPGAFLVSYLINGVTVHETPTVNLSTSSTVSRGVALDSTCMFGAMFVK